MSAGLQVFTMIHLRLLVNLLRGIAPQWKKLGILLGVHPNDLENIEKHWIADYLRRVLKLWIQKYDAAVECLLGALRSIDMIVEAREVEHYFCK